jgi:hypothetical protein
MGSFEKRSNSRGCRTWETIGHFAPCSPVRELNYTQEKREVVSLAAKEENCGGAAGEVAKVKKF